MSGVIPVTGMYHLGVVTADYRRGMQNYSKILGIESWDVRVMTNERFRNPLVNGKNVRQHFISALGIGPVSIELCQPLAGDRTLYAEFLEEKGPGLHHICPTIISQEEFISLLPDLDQRGLKFVQSAEISDTIDYWYIDATDRIGTYIELLVIKGPNAVGSDVDETVRFGPEITRSAGRLPIDKLYHYTVTARLPAETYKSGYQDLFGIEDWYTFEAKPNETTRASKYAGRPEDFKFRTWSGRKDVLGIEIVEPEGGNSIFTEKLDRNGSGMHHIMTTITNAQRWEKTSQWLKAEGLSIAQDHWTPDGSAYVAFIDARERLDNMYIEVIVRQDDSEPLVGREADILVGP